MEPPLTPKHDAFNAPHHMPRYANLGDVLANLSITWRNLMDSDTTGTNSARALEVDEEMSRILGMMRELSTGQVHVHSPPGEGRTHAWDIEEHDTEIDNG